MASAYAAGCRKIIVVDEDAYSGATTEDDAPDAPHDRRYSAPSL